MTVKPFKPSVRYDAQYKQYVDTLKKETGLHGAQIIRLALFTAGSNPEFITKLKQYTDGVLEMPDPEWDQRDDNMWLLQQGDGDGDAEPVIMDTPVIADPPTHAEEPGTVGFSGGGLVFRL